MDALEAVHSEKYKLLAAAEDLRAALRERERLDSYIALAQEAYERALRYYREAQDIALVNILSSADLSYGEQD